MGRLVVNIISSQVWKIILNNWNLLRDIVTGLCNLLGQGIFQNMHYPNRGKFSGQTPVFLFRLGCDWLHSHHFQSVSHNNPLIQRYCGVTVGALTKMQIQKARKTLVENISGNPLKAISISITWQRYSCQEPYIMVTTVQLTTEEQDTFLSDKTWPTLRVCGGNFWLSQTKCTRTNLYK
jgi:hypothetical protein